jgi:hypothetical protein
MTPTLDVPMELLGQHMPPAHIPFTYIGYGICAIALVVAIRLASKYRSFVPIGLLIGAGTLVCYEPIADVMGKCWFPAIDQMVAVTAFGRSTPLFLLTSYFWYVGGLAVYIMHRLRRGDSTRILWAAYVLIGLADFLLEFAPNHQGMQTYYGHQPLVVFGMPMWWTFVNPLMPIFSGVIAYLGLKLFSGARGILSITIPPISAGVGVGSAWPTWVALNSDITQGQADLAALATLLLGCCTVWFLCYLVNSMRSGTAAA